MSDHFKKMEESRVKHPSYGTVQFVRICGSAGRLFGSSIGSHSSTILLEIREADRTHDLSRDRIMGHDIIIQVELSQAQFAEVLTTMNQGTGIPCTIRRRDGKFVEDPPDDLLEVAHVREDFTGELKELTAYVKQEMEELEKILAKATIAKKTKEKIMWVLGKTLQEVEANWPFVLKQFNKATEKVVTAAKAEVDAFVTHVVQQTGLKQLEKMKLLEAPPDDKDD